MLAMFEFDEGLPAEIQLWIHRTGLCKRYLAERARVGKLAADCYERTGALNDPALCEEIAAVEALGQELRRKIDARLEGAGMPPK